MVICPKCQSECSEDYLYKSPATKKVEIPYICQSCAYFHRQKEAPALSEVGFSKKRTRGRPRRFEGRDEVRIRFNPHEYFGLLATAKKEKVNLTELLRRVVLDAYRISEQMKRPMFTLLIAFPTIDKETIEIQEKLFAARKKAKREVRETFRKVKAKIIRPAPKKVIGPDEIRVVHGVTIVGPDITEDLPCNGLDKYFEE